MENIEIQHSKNFLNFSIMKPKNFDEIFAQRGEKCAVSDMVNNNQYEKQ